MGSQVCNSVAENETRCGRNDAVCEEEAGVNRLQAAASMGFSALAGVTGLVRDLG